MTNVICTGTIPGGCLGGEKTGAGKACQEIGRGLLGWQQKEAIHSHCFGWEPSCHIPGNPPSTRWL